MVYVATTDGAITVDPEFDIQSHDLYLDGPPYARFERLRREAPLFRHECGNRDEIDWFWALTRYDDIVTVSRQWDVYSSAAGVTLARERPDMELARMMLEIDPPDHTRLRNLVSPGFSPRPMRRLTDHYADVTRRLVDEAIAATDVDFVAAVAAELPLITIAELLGIPVEDRHRVFEWANRMVGMSDPDYSGGQADGAAAAAELYVYAQELATDRRRNPRDDVITVLVSGTDGDVLTEHEFNVFVLLLSVAGSETTRNAISHGVVAMIEHPDQWARLRSHPELIRPAVEEILRWATPVNTFRRTARTEVRLHGETIGEGDPVVLFYASANRDPEVFDDPDRFDIGRHPNPHLSFGGGGPHFCLGASLARLEMTALFGELAARCESIDLTGPIGRLRSSFINGIKTLPVRLNVA
jgi:cholest-4-en-3-one 26-monooxygenase